MPQVGEPAPDFILPSTVGPLSLSQILREGRVVLAFYFQDNTPNCSLELSSLKEEYTTLRELGAQVVGVSADGLESHHAFSERAGGFPFPLASDEELTVARLYDVVGEDGQRSRRAIFVIEGDGTILHVIPWYQPGNVAQFMEVFQALGLQE